MGRIVVLALTTLLCIALVGRPEAASSQATGSGPPATPVDRQAALHEMIAVGIQRTVKQLGHPGGFYRTPEFHIRLPASLDKIVDTLAADYAPLLATTLEKDINVAAEGAVEPAGRTLAQLLPNVTFADPDQILHGPNNAATLALQKQIGSAFSQALRPTIKLALEKADAPAALYKMQSRYEQLTNRSFAKFDLEDFALHSFQAAFLASLADQEQDIRLRPSARTTEALQQLFSHN